MDATQIQIGRHYTDNRGNVRQVTALHGEHRPPAGGSAPARVEYRLLVKRRSSQVLNRLYATPLREFARWACRECG